MTVLVTAFDAFDGEEVNSSELVLNLLRDRAIAGVIATVLPTSYRQAEADVGRLIQAHRPPNVVMLGLARNASLIRLETTARNVDDCATPDNDGETRSGQAIAIEGPAQYRSSLPLKLMTEIAERKGIETETSDDAGAFVCNHLFFAVAHALTCQPFGGRCGFVHLPPIVDRRRLIEVTDLIEAWVLAIQSHGEDAG